MKVSQIKSVEDGANFQVVCALKSFTARSAKNGRDFLILDFADNSGSFGAMCFESSAAFEILKCAKVGEVFEINATADTYQGKPSPKLENARKLEDEEVDAIRESLAQVSPFNPKEMQNELYQIINDISHAPLRETVRYALDSTNGAFFTSTAAVKMHHAYIYGLLEHTLRCAKTARALLPLYPLIDKDLTLAGTILHDIGKTIEYTQTLAPERSRAGILQGHVVLGYKLVRKAGLKNSLSADILERLEHIILSHQGEPEWGAAVRAATPEAVFVSCVDNFDAKMGALEAAIEASLGDEFAEVGALRSKVLTLKPEYPPQAQ